MIALCGFDGSGLACSSTLLPLGSCRSVDNYERISRIGEGTYGVVYKAKSKDTGEIVALKKIRLVPESDPAARSSKGDDLIPADGLPLAHMREIQLLKRLKHPNIVQVKEIVVGGSLGSIFTVMEYCVNDLAALVDSMVQPYSRGEIKCLIYQLLKGVEYLHRNFIIHRDLKLSNLLINSDGCLKIADFGLARKCSIDSQTGLPYRPLTPKVVTLWYRAPELLFGDINYSFPIDLWSVGCIFGELLLNSPLLPGSTELQQVILISRLIGSPNNTKWAGFDRLPLAKSLQIPQSCESTLKLKFTGETLHTIDLLQRFLMYDPSKRITIPEACGHLYFNEEPRRVDRQFLRTFPDQRQNGSAISAPRNEFGAPNLHKPASLTAINVDINRETEQTAQSSSSIRSGPDSISSIAPSAVTSLGSYLKRRHENLASAETKKKKQAE